MFFMIFLNYLQSIDFVNAQIQRSRETYYFRKIFNNKATALLFLNNFNNEPSSFIKTNKSNLTLAYKTSYEYSSSSAKQTKYNFFINLIEMYRIFKISIFSKLSINEAWAALTHLFWVKTRVAYYMNNWIYTTNHKRIAVNYFWFVILSGIVGMVLATLIRLEFAYPGAGVFVGDSLQYLSLATAHGVIMVFFMIMPLLFGAFANFLLPTQLGVHDVAFPRLNSAAFWFLPGGLLMLCQLVCVDKRYQRMNCFNIREIQSILKKKFYPDLINSHDHHQFLNKTALGLRFKTQNTNAINGNTQIFYNYGIENSSKVKSNFYRFANEGQGSDSSFFNLNSGMYKILSFIKSNSAFSVFSVFTIILVKASNFTLKIFLFFTKTFWNVSTFFFKSLTYLVTLSALILNTCSACLLDFNLSFGSLKALFASAQLVGIIIKNALLGLAQIVVRKREDSATVNIGVLANLNAYAQHLLTLTLSNIYKLTVRNFVEFKFWLKQQKFADLPIFMPVNWTSLTAELLYGSKTNPVHDRIYTGFINYLNANYVTFKFFSYKFNSTNIVNLMDADLIKISNLDSSSSFRDTKFFNPSIKYNYKSGDYFTKFNKDMYTYLFAILSDLTSLAKLTPWFYSDKYNDLLAINVENFFDFITTDNEESLMSKKWTPYVFGSADGFYNFFFELSTNTQFLNAQYLSSANLQQKFYKMFHTNSMQQRILGNWRQLKFTREAWRCKLLSARHQKTLFRRYTHEDGVFWSIERNAKDLLPGWAMITPFSSRTRFTAVGKTDIGLMGVLLVLNSSIISAANFLVTYRYLSTLNNRKMRDARAFFTEGIMVSSWMMVTANPMLVIGIVMLLSDRHWQTSFFDYSGGGDTVLFQHMFWFFGHPEVYIIIIPTFGFTNTILSYYFRKRISARASLLYSMYTIAFLGFFVWGHHMYMVGLAHTTRMLFSTLTVMISVPAATKIMHWCVTFVNSSFAAELPLLFILTFIFFFTSGGISGMCVAHTGMDVLFHDTFYVIAHFHVMLAGSAMFASFGAFYFYFPAIFGVKYSRLYAYLHFTYYLLGQLMTVIPMFWLGYAGMPRRVLDYPASFGGWHSVISAGHMLSVAGLMSFFIMIFDSLRQGRAVVRNTFGISRYNTRLNFYLYAIGQHVYAQQKGQFLFKFLKPGSLKLNTFNFKNHEPLESVLITYSFYKK